MATLQVTVTSSSLGRGPFLAKFPSLPNLVTLPFLFHLKNAREIHFQHQFDRHSRSLSLVPADTSAPVDVVFGSPVHQPTPGELENDPAPSQAVNESSVDGQEILPNLPPAYTQHPPNHVRFTPAYRNPFRRHQNARPGRMTPHHNWRGVQNFHRPTNGHNRRRRGRGSYFPSTPRHSVHRPPFPYSVSGVRMLRHAADNLTYDLESFLNHGPHSPVGQMILPVLRDSILIVRTFVHAADPFELASDDLF